MRHSKGGRFLAVILAGILALNCNTATVFADDAPQDPAAEVQIQEEPQDTDPASDQDAASHAENEQDISSAEDSLQEEDGATDSSDSAVDEPEAEDNEETIQEDPQESSDLCNQKTQKGLIIQDKS